MLNPGYTKERAKEPKSQTTQTPPLCRRRLAVQAQAPRNYSDSSSESTGTDDSAEDEAGEAGRAVEEGEDSTKSSASGVASLPRPVGLKLLCSQLARSQLACDSQPTLKRITSKMPSRATRMPCISPCMSESHSVSERGARGRPWRSLARTEASTRAVKVPWAWMSVSSGMRASPAKNLRDMRIKLLSESWCSGGTWEKSVSVKRRRVAGETLPLRKGDAICGIAHTSDSQTCRKSRRPDRRALSSASTSEPEVLRRACGALAWE